MSNFDENMNNSYYTTLNENFTNALTLMEESISHNKILSMLNSGNIVQKQIAALKINSINSEEEALTLAKNLTGCDGKIREAVSLKISEFAALYPQFFASNEIADILLNAIIDVNSNICRNIIPIIPKLDIKDYFIPKLIDRTKNLIDEVAKFDLQDGKYKINKEVFKLYWYLETIFELSDFIDMQSLKSILLNTQNIQDYTIREITAKILSKNFDDYELEFIRKKLKQDVNYYVSRF